MTARPWRAAAYYKLGPTRLFVGHASAKTRAGLDRFIADWQGTGATVETWEVRPIPEVERITQRALSAGR